MDVRVLYVLIGLVMDVREIIELLESDEYEGCVLGLNWS